MGISPTTLQAIKAVPLSDILKKCELPLKRVGREFLALCPWHDDTNPSLTINDDKGFCYCHVCHGGGDIIKFMQQRFGLSWRDAIERVAALAEIEIELTNEDPEETARRREKRRKLIANLELEQNKYKANLRNPKASAIRNILKERGLQPATAKYFGIGYANSGFFANRITLPIYDHHATLVGFTGRATDNETKPKYKNSSDNELFNKKTIVFNEKNAKEAAKLVDSIIFVEGHFDVVAMWQAGIKNVVAVQGTSAPDTLVLKRLARGINKFILCFDGDLGGTKAVEQFLSTAGPLALAGEISIDVVTLPDGEDPDSIIKNGGNLYNYLASAPSWLDWIIDNWTANLDRSNSALLTEVETRLKRLIDSLKSKALRTHYIDKACRVLTNNEKEAEKLSKEWGNAEFFYAEAPWRPRTPSETRLAAERRLLRIYVHRPGLRGTLQPLLERVSNPALKWLINRISEIESLSAVDLTPHTVMAIVSVAEPYYLGQLRTLVRPNVIIDDAPGVIDHLQKTLELTITS